jgi:hypothetical protein
MLSSIMLTGIMQSVEMTSIIMLVLNKQVPLSRVSLRTAMLSAITPSFIELNFVIKSFI